VICLGYKGYVIKEFFFNDHMADVTFDLRDHSTVVHRKRAEPWRVTLVETGDAPFHMTYGDGVADIDLDALTACHQRNGMLATITAVQPPGRFGVLNIDDGGRVRRRKALSTSVPGAGHGTVGDRASGGPLRRPRSLADRRVGATGRRACDAGCGYGQSADPPRLVGINLGRCRSRSGVAWGLI
jgi:hypothetical protein